MVDRYPLDKMKAAIRQVLPRHGLEAPIKMIDLHVVLTGELVIPGKRHDMARVTRKLIAELRQEGCPIGSSQQGYFWAKNHAELAGTIERFHTAAMHSLRQVKALRKLSSTALARQVKLELDEQEVAS